MIRIEISTTGSSLNYDNRMFEKRLKVAILLALADLTDGKSVEVKSVNFVKPKSR